MPGGPGDRLDAGERSGAARALGEFPRSLHQPAHREAPANHVRGVLLDHVAERFARRLGELDGVVNASRVLALWHEAAMTPPWGGPRIWLHGDLHPANLIFDGRRLSGVFDFGDLCGGDPATDIAGGFLTLPFDSLDDFLDAYGPVDAATLERTLGWVLQFGLMFLSLGLSHDQTYGPIGALAIDNVLT
jgi:aminoglycoside phosphotransferase (APT) family kinase protein